MNRYTVQLDDTVFEPPLNDAEEAILRPLFPSFTSMDVDGTSYYSVRIVVPAEDELWALLRAHEILRAAVEALRGSPTSITDFGFAASMIPDDARSITDV